MLQERNNDVITGVTLPSENKISSVPFGSYSKALHDTDPLTLGSQLLFTSIGKCNFSLRNLILIFRWHAGFD